MLLVFLEVEDGLQAHISSQAKESRILELSAYNQQKRWLGIRRGLKGTGHNFEEQRIMNFWAFLI